MTAPRLASAICGPVLFVLYIDNYSLNKVEIKVETLESNGPHHFQNQQPLELTPLGVVNFGDVY